MEEINKLIEETAERNAFDYFAQWQEDKDAHLENYFKTLFILGYKKCKEIMDKREEELKEKLFEYFWNDYDRKVIKEIFESGGKE